MIRLKEGETLLEKDHRNDRLFYLHDGVMIGYDGELDIHGMPAEKLLCEQGGFIGLHSFFSKRAESIFTIVAKNDCLVSYIDRDQPVITEVGATSLAEQFMPLVIERLAYRQEVMCETIRQQEKASAQVQEYQRLATLGQLSAGVAHELNNALAVITRGSEWLSFIGEKLISRRGEREKEYYRLGLEKGHAVSSRDARKQKKLLKEKYSIHERDAHAIATMGLTEIDDDLVEKLSEYIKVWEMGTTLHDLRLASEHCEHVVYSMKTLGAKHESMEDQVRVNDSIRQAYILVENKLRAVKVEMDLQAEGTIRGNRGGLIQIWSNLMKNALEACQEDCSDIPEIKIISQEIDEQIEVAIIDNGPGIPSDLLPKIFQPNVTTKKKGLSFGLGLGLTLVQRLIDEHLGQIEVDSQPGKTIFKVRFPKTGVSDE